MIPGIVRLLIRLFRYLGIHPKNWERVWNAKQEKCWGYNPNTSCFFKNINAMEVKVTVEKSPDGTYSAFMEDDMPDFGLAGYGDSAKEAIEDFYNAFEETKNLLAQSGKNAPDLKFNFMYDLQSFFSYFSYLNISKVGEKSGISPSLMRQYVSGTAKAGPKQFEKIRTAISEIVGELSVASI